MRAPLLTVAVAVALSGVLTSGAAAAPDPDAYRANDAGGFRDILPPGTDGVANAADLGAFTAFRTRPKHNDDQLETYANLVYAAPGLKAEQLDDFFKDASFGVKPGQAERTYSPRGDVTIVRDAGFGVPHVYGQGRNGAMFGLGYVGAEDRLFLIDVLRNLGRASLSSFAGGAAGNREQEQEQFRVAPYTDADYRRQIDQLDDLYGPDGASLQKDIANYVAGINAYITEAKLDASKLPAEYAAIGRPGGPEPWLDTDVIAIASLVGGIFGKGGGDELRDAQILQQFMERFGLKKGRRLYRDFRALEDPESPTTVQGKNFIYERPPRKPRGVALPDVGSVAPDTLITAATGSGATRSTGARATAISGVLGGLDAFPDSLSNALVVSGAESESGRPLAVFGPQVNYFSPQILMEEDVHAPAGPEGAGIDARGAAFPGVNLYVQLGRGRDYAWSATSAGQDIVDVYAVDLCNPGGGTATKEAVHYKHRGACIPMETIARTNSWTPSAGDMTPPGSYTLRRQRTKLGIVTHRATVRGKPVAFTQLRSTYLHEVDSALGFADFNDPAAMENVGEFQRAASRIGYAFNWFYADDKDVGYFNSGNNPERAPGTDPNLPMRGRKAYEWQGFDADANTARYTSFEAHPQAINQPFLTSWNNKQAKGFRGAKFGRYTPIYRSSSLDDRVRAGTAGTQKMTLVELVDAMEDAGTVDLRGAYVLPLALKVIGASADGDPQLGPALKALREWAAAGGHRLDRNRDGVYDHAEAIRISDAWWPLLLEAQFKPVLGEKLFATVRDAIAFHSESAGSPDFNGGWYGYAQKDLRTVLGRKVRGRYGRRFCGSGLLKLCRTALADSLRAAVGKTYDELYAEDPECKSVPGAAKQFCSDSTRFKAIGAIRQPAIHWINRPTYQQIVEIQGHRPR